MARLLTALALASMAALSGPSRAQTSPETFSLRATLQPDLPGPPDALPISLSASFSYDAANSSGSGAFTLGSYVADFAGFAFLDGNGLLFDGVAADATSLYLSIGTTSAGGGSVHFCPLGAFCSFFTNLSGTDFDPTDDPTDPGQVGTGFAGGAGGSSDPGSSGSIFLPAVPLPGALPLFGSVLLLFAAGSRAWRTSVSSRLKA